MHVALPSSYPSIVDMPELVDQLIEHAALELQAASGGAALCRMTASGSPGSRVKWAEGQWAALHKLSRSIASGTEDPQSYARALLAQWEGDLDRWREKPGSSWIPYCEGGVSGLREFIDETGNADAS